MLPVLARVVAVRARWCAALAREMTAHCAAVGLPSTRGTHLGTGLRAVDEDQNYAHAALQGGPDFESDVVIGVIESALPGIVGDRQLLGARQGHHDMARVDRIADNVPETEAGLNGVHVREDMRLREALAQLGLQQPPTWRAQNNQFARAERFGRKPLLPGVTRMCFEANKPPFDARRRVPVSGCVPFGHRH